MPFTLSLYIARRYAYYLLTALATVAGIMWLFDSMELMRIASTRLTTSVILGMALLKNYGHVQHILPLVVFLSSLLFYSNMARCQELVVCRTLGMSIWQILLPAILVSLMFSVICLFIMNPIGASMLSRYEHIEASELKGHSSLLALASKGVWLRQYDEEETLIIHAMRIDQSQHELFEVIIFVMDDDGRFVRRIEAGRATLMEKDLVLHNVLITTSEYVEQFLPQLAFATSLTFAQLQDSITPPQTVAMLKLPAFIREAQEAGFPVLRHKLYLYQLLAMPLFFIAMTLLSAGFINLTPRQNRAGASIVRGIMAVLVIHFANDIITAFGTSGAINLAVAAILPALLCTLLGCYMLLHHEEH